MKKLLLASAALAMVAGPVAAQGLNLSGYARFGIDYLENRTGGFSNDEVATHSRFRISMSASTETDFGATLSVIGRAQADNGGTMNINAPRFTVSGGGLGVALGNICGAIECMPNIYFGSRSAGMGLSGLGFHNMAANVSGNFFAWDAYSSGGAGAAANNGVEVTYSMAGIGAHLSYSDQNPDLVAGTPRRERIAGHASYTFGDYTAALGFQDSDNVIEQKVILTVGANFDDFRVNFQAADNRGVKKVALAGSFAVTPEATLFGFIANESSNRAGQTQFDGTSGGLGVSYALGGGASIESGVIRSSDSLVRADFGMFFSF